MHTPHPYGAHFDEDYFLRGKETGKSNYENYRYQPEVTRPCVRAMVRYLGARPGADTIHDWGCAIGTYVAALRELGHCATGHDISEWAHTNRLPQVKQFVFKTPPSIPVDWVLCKDVLEHVPFSHLPHEIAAICKLATMGALLIVPLSDCDRRVFITPADNADPSHRIKATLEDWLDMIQVVVDETCPGKFAVSAGYKLPGVKQAADPYPKSCGFITLRTIA